MVRLFEYQGKKLLKSSGIPVPDGDVAQTPAEVRSLAEKIGKPVAIKAQIWATGRFKAGGIKFANTPEEAEKVAKELIGKEIKGFKVKKVLIEEQIGIAQEFYVGIVIDDSYKVKGPVMMLSSEGGVDVEETAKKSPEKISSINIDVDLGMQPQDAQNLIENLGLAPNLIEPIKNLVLNLFKTFEKYE